MAISDSLINAHENLLRVIPKPLTTEEEAERVRTCKGLPEVDPTALHDAARRFVDAISTEPAMMTELNRRATLCAALTGEGSDYLTAKSAAHKSLRRWKPKEAIVQKLAGYFQQQGDREVVASVRDEHDHLERLLGWNVPKETRARLEAWRDAAWSIVSKGENESLDGCYWLLHADRLRHALFVPAAAPEVRRAADALVKWCDAQAIEGKPQAAGRSSVNEADAAAMKLATRDPRFVDGKARGWAAAIGKATGKTCSTAAPIATQSPKEQRDKWIYGECMKGTPYKTIAIRLNKKPKKWSRIESVNGIKMAAKRYAERHSLPMPPARQSGRHPA